MISRNDFESFLGVFTVVDDPSSKEVIYEIPTSSPKVNIKIYSSIELSGVSRNLGEDAIRCVLIDSTSNKPIDKAKRTHRMSNWKERLKEKLDVLKEEVKNLKLCKSCGSVMVLRDGPKGQFYGCLAYPLCKTSMDLSGVTRVKSEPSSKTIEGIVRCPDCDAPMSKRSGRRGDFYGCSNFFKTGCKGTRQVEEVEIYGKGVEEEHFEEEPLLSNTPIFEPQKEEVKPAKEIDLVPTSQFPYLKFKFEHFNPVQSEVFKYYDKDVNCVVAAATSAGKTTVAEMFMAHSISQGKKAIFLSPLKAVSQEKYEDWTDSSHDWSKLNISIVTGDYALTDARVEELNKANVIIMTTEMLDSRTRRMLIEKNFWLNDCGVVVCDESHLLCVRDRGDKLESAIMRFTRQNPLCRIVFLSATMSNVDELARWLSSLNNKKSELINSDYRPIRLDIYYEPYDDYGNYQTVEQNKIKKTIELGLQKYALNQQVLVFVHSKKTGKIIYDMFLNKGIKPNEIDYHYGDLDLKTRVNVEKRTKSKEIKILISTSTLAWGINI
jgi:superfamily II helicase